MVTYYAVYGTNGCGVVGSWERVINARIYIRAFNCKKFNDFTAAEAYALSKLSEFVSKTHLRDKCIIPDKLQLGDLIFVSHLIQQV